MRKLSFLSNKKGLTIIEVIITMAMTAILFASIIIVFLACCRTFFAGQNRSKVRTQLSQAIDLITKDFHNARSIAVCTGTTLTFNPNLGLGASAYSYNWNNNNLYKPSGAVIATGILQPGTTASWGTVPSIFSCNNSTVNGWLTVDMTAVNNGQAKNAAVNVGETVHARSNIWPRTLPVGLIGWWKLDEAASGTCSGAKIIDSSGNGNTGTCNSSPTWVSGHIGIGAMSFNGSSNYISVSSTSFLPSGNAPRTMTGWIQTNGYQSGRMAYFGYGGAATDTAFGLSSGINSDGKIYFLGYADDWAGNTVVGDGNWHFIAVTYDGTTVTLYVDGNYDSSASKPSLNTSNMGTYPFVIARQSYSDAGNYHYVNGFIDDVRVYNRALSADEIYQIYGQRPFSWLKFDAYSSGTCSTSFTDDVTGWTITCRNGPQWVAGLIGLGAMSFTGSSSQYIYYPAGTPSFANSLDDTAQFSISVWFKTTGAGGIISDNINRPSGTCSYNDAILYVESNGKLHAGGYIGSIPALESSQIVNDGNWHHAVYTNNGAPTQTQTLYLDGALVGSVTGTMTGGNGYTLQWVIGVANTGYGGVTWPNGNGNWYYFTGTMDDLRFYSNVLGPDDVLKIYNGEE